jgi:hypothetical protein
MRESFARFIVAVFVKVLLRLKGAQGLVCRSCAATVYPELAFDFIELGCPTCGGFKLSLKEKAAQ